MKRTYDFSVYEPPVLTQAALQTRLEKRRLRRQVAAAALAAGLLEACVLVLAAMTHGVYPLLALACAAYFLFSVTAGSVLLIVYAYKRRSIQCAC